MKRAMLPGVWFVGLAVTSLLCSGTRDAGAVEAFFSFEGLFPGATEQQEFYFRTAPSALFGTDLVAETFGYDGGTNRAGDAISAGGFDPILSVRDSGNTQVAINDDAVPGTIFDSRITAADFTGGSAPADTYTLRLEAFQGTYPGGTSPWATDLAGLTTEFQTLTLLGWSNPVAFGPVSLKYGTDGAVAGIEQPARLELNDPLSVRLTGDLVAGDQGKAELEINTNAVLRVGGEAILGQGGTRVTAVVDGSGAALDVTNRLIVGNGAGAQSSLRISNGAEVTSGQLFVGDFSNIIAQVDIESGGQLNITSALVGNSGTAQGTINLSGIGSKLTGTSTMFMGRDTGATGVMNIFSGGTAELAGQRIRDNAVVTVQDGGTLRVDDLQRSGTGVLQTFANSRVGINSATGLSGVAGELSVGVDVGGAVGDHTVSGANPLTNVGQNLIIGDDAPGTLRYGALGNTTVGNALVVGSGATGSLRFEGASNMNVGAHGRIGSASATGTLFVDAGSQLFLENFLDVSSGNAVIVDGEVRSNTTLSTISEIAGPIGSIAGVVVDGPTSVYTVATTAPLAVGSRGRGALTVRNQGRAAGGGNLFIGWMPGAEGTVEIVGANNTLGLDVLGTFYVGGGVSGAGGRGFLDLSNGGRVLAGAVVNHDTGDIVLGGEITAPGGVVNDGLIYGPAPGDIGTIIGDLQNNNQVAPGQSTAVILVTSDFTQSATGLLSIELVDNNGAPGVDFDKLSVGGTLNAAGTLEVLLAGGFDPGIGDVFDILDFASASGSFDNLLLPVLINKRWDTTQLLTSGVLRVLAGIVGDYNNSGQVEQGDLDLVLQNWGLDTDVAGVPAGWLNDLPSGQIEQTELDRVLQNWGNTASPVEHPASVPEPAVLGVVLAALMPIGRGPRPPGAG